MYEEVKIPAIDGFWASSGERLQISGRPVAGQPSWSSFYDATANVLIDFDFDDGGATAPVDGQLAGWTIEYSLAPDPTIHRFEFLDNSRARDSRTVRTYVNRFVPELTNGAWCVVGDTGKGFVFANDGSLPDRLTDFSTLGLIFTAPGTAIESNAPVQLEFEVADLPSSPDGRVVSFTHAGTNYSGVFEGVSTMSLTSASGAVLILQRSKRTDCTL